MIIRRAGIFAGQRRGDRGKSIGRPAAERVARADVNDDDGVPWASIAAVRSRASTTAAAVRSSAMFTGCRDRSAGGMPSGVNRSHWFSTE